MTWRAAITLLVAGLLFCVIGAALFVLGVDLLFPSPAEPRIHVPGAP